MEIENQTELKLKKEEIINLRGNLDGIIKKARELKNVFDAKLIKEMEEQNIKEFEFGNYIIKKIKDSKDVYDEEIIRQSLDKKELLEAMPPSIKWRKTVLKEMFDPETYNEVCKKEYKDKIKIVDIPKQISKGQK